MKRYVRFLGAGLCAFVALAPLSAVAAPVLRSGESVTVADTQEVQDDFYAVGGSVTVSGKVAGDLYAAASTIIVNGEVTEDVVVAGGTAHIDGPVGGDIRMVGGDIVIAGTVKGDVLVTGGIVRVLSTARIEGDILFWGGELDMDGDLRGSLSGRAETVRINGHVGGAVSVTAARMFELGDQTRIDGAVSYISGQELSRAPGSVVAGDITKAEAEVSRAGMSSRIVPVLALFFAVLVCFMVFRTGLERLLRHTLDAPIKHGLLGLGVCILGPIVAGVLMVSVVGLPVGVALFLFYILLFLTSAVLIGPGIGFLLSRYIGGTAAVSLKWTILGTLALVLLLFIPVVGIVLGIIAELVVAGGIVSMLYARLRR